MAHWFPKAGGATRPSPGWYWGWALYVNRGGFRGAFVRLAPVGAALLVAAAMVPSHGLRLGAALAFAVAGLVLLHSIVGHALVYGRPAGRYFDRLLALGAVRAPARVADLHIGTWRHTYALLDRLPSAHVVSIDIWAAGAEATEGAVRELRELELAASPADRLKPVRAGDGHLPLADESMDVVVLGLGSHEIEGAPQDHLLREARRVLKPDGTLLFFEHAKNWQSFLIFGPGIAHWTTREEWTRRLSVHFANVRSQRTPYAVDLFAAERAA
jgi:SAM-dependent methyltransferase